jgi:hypothetical protein
LINPLDGNLAATWFLKGVDVVCKGVEKITSLKSIAWDNGL